MSSRKVAVIGLGAMGIGIAGTLVDKGFDVKGFDLSPQRCAEAAKGGVIHVETPADAVEQSDFAVLSLPNGPAVVSTVNACVDILPLRKDRKFVFIDTSTSEAEISRMLAKKLSAIGHGFIDAPVSGGPDGAADGALTIMLGGDDADIALARPMLEALASKIFHVGPSGAGNVAKLANNLLAAAHLVTSSEAMRLAVAAGVEPEAVLRVVNAASGRSAISETHFPRWVTSGHFNSGFTMGLMRKDVGLALNLAEAHDLELPLSRAVASLWQVAPFTDSDDFTRMGSYLPDSTARGHHD